jgi:ABC-type nitrate/sulfonate/bicarbonate transport system permease component
VSSDTAPRGRTPGFGGGPGTTERTVSVLSPVVLLLLWELAARAGWVDVRFFPAPSEILRQLAAMIASAEIWPHLGMTLTRVVVGFALGAIPGVAIGLAMGVSPLVAAIVQPLVQATFPIPKVAILPLFILLLGLGEASKYAVVAVSVIYIALINAYEGVRDIDPIHFDVGRNYGAGRGRLFLDIALPGALPQIFTGLKTSFGVALLVIVAAEFVGAKSGIGFLIWNSWQIFAIEKLYVGLMATALLGFGSAALFTVAERVLIPWRRR